MTARIVSAVCLALLSLSLTACGTTNVTRTSTATAIASLSTPTNVPAGWQVYAPPVLAAGSTIHSHFIIAYPTGWSVKVQPTSARTNQPYPGPNGQPYTFQSTDGQQFVEVYETDGLTSDQMRNTCTAPSESHVTYAGLPMLFNLDANGSVRDYSFLTQQGAAYQLLSDANASATTKALYDSIFATFRPQYTTSACQ